MMDRAVHESHSRFLFDLPGLCDISRKIETPIYAPSRLTGPESLVERRLTSLSIEEAASPQDGMSANPFTPSDVTPGCGVAFLVRRISDRCWAYVHMVLRHLVRACSSLLSGFRFLHPSVVPRSSPLFTSPYSDFQFDSHVLFHHLHIASCLLPSFHHAINCVLHSPPNRRFFFTAP